MISQIYIDNFKSLVEFKIKFAKFSCLVGLNGAGKSTVLQAIDFLAQLMHGEVDSWLNERGWDAADLNSKLSPRSNIDFKVNVSLDGKGDFVWSGSVNRKSLNCTSESVTLNGEQLLKVFEGDCTLRTEPNNATERFPVVFQYQGSILSQLKENQIRGPLVSLRDEMLNVHSLDLLSPAQLRLKTRTADGQLGLGGQHLSAYLHELGKNKREALTQQLANVYHQLVSIETKSLRSGWKQLGIRERFGNQFLSTSATHINDGMLRLMAILSQLSSNQRFLIFDEIENGINPELVEFLVDTLVMSNHQVLVTTHSPMILNFMDDDVAREGVHYLYKTKKGFTRSIRLFDIPSISKKLEFMGPGEAFIDTDLTKLYAEIADIQSTEA